ncbi:MAG: hypothetical protein ACK5X3_24555, partial [Pseudomonadota bacterium]
MKSKKVIGVPVGMRGVVRVKGRAGPVMHPLILRNRVEVDDRVLREAEEVIERHGLMRPRGKGSVALSREEEAALFVAMNLCRVRSGEGTGTAARGSWGGGRVRPPHLLTRPCEVELWVVMARRFEAVIHAANIGLVYKYALHGHAGGDADAQSDASISLLRAIWTFDVQRGYKFSTYATNTIKINSGHVLAELASVRGKAEQYLRANKRPATYRHEPADDDGLNARRARIVRELLDRPDGHDVLGLPAEAMVLLRMRVDEGASNLHMCAVRGLDKDVVGSLLWLAITGMAKYVDGVVGVGVG